MVLTLYYRRPQDTWGQVGSAIIGRPHEVIRFPQAGVASPVPGIKFCLQPQRVVCLSRPRECVQWQGGLLGDQRSKESPHLLVFPGKQVQFWEWGPREERGWGRGGQSETDRSRHHNVVTEKSSEWDLPAEFWPRVSLHGQTQPHWPHCLHWPLSSSSWPSSSSWSSVTEIEGQFLLWPLASKFILNHEHSWWTWIDYSKLCTPVPKMIVKNLSIFCSRVNVNRVYFIGLDNLCSCLSEMRIQSDGIQILIQFCDGRP